MAVMQVFAIAATLFALYYFLMRVLGAEKIGLWSLVLATTSAAHLGGLGMTGGVVKFVSRYIALNERRTAAACVETAAVSVFVLIAIFIVLLYPALAWILKSVLPAENIASGIDLLPYSLVSFLIAAVAGVFSSGLDGLQRIDIRSFLASGCAVIHLLFAFVLVPRYGLMGLAYAQVIQSIALLIGAWYFLHKILPELSRLLCKWNKALFQEMFVYGLNFQVTSFVQMLFDPVTKVLIGMYGGLAAISYFEMSNRLIVQCRSLVVAANQVLVPVIATKYETERSEVRKIYASSVRLVAYLTLPMYSAIIAAAPIVSEVWVGRKEPLFVIFTAILSVGWFVNNLAAPAYFGNLGSGHLRWNTASHVVIGLLNLSLGILLGYNFGAVGIVAGFALALIFGSGLLLFKYQESNDISAGAFLPGENRGLLFACVVAPILVWLSQYWIRDVIGLPLMALVSFSIFSVVIFPAMWRHPLRDDLLDWLAEGFRRPVSNK